MVKIKYWIIFLGLVAGGIGVSLGCFQSEEKKIKRQFHHLSEGISKKSGENVFTMDQKIKKIGSLFSDVCEIDIPSYSLSGQLTREEIMSYAARGRLQTKTLQMKIYDLKVFVLEGNKAQAHMTVRLTGQWMAGETIHEAHEIDCSLEKKENEWLLTKVELVEVLKR